ncbi:MAG: hypothetical protein OEM32_04560 [Acidimicrobiia bacterium]|nr:hypothetical protein [Acidimicrobiia bacterium]
MTNHIDALIEKIIGGPISDDYVLDHDAMQGIVSKVTMLARRDLARELKGDSDRFVNDPVQGWLWLRSMIRDIAEGGEGE